MHIFVFIAIAIVIVMILSCIFVHKISIHCENTEGQDLAILEG